MVVDELTEFSRLERKNIQYIMKKNPELAEINHILGIDRNGNTNHGSLLFYILPRLYGKLLSNDPNKVLSKRSVALRGKLAPGLRRFGLKLLSGKTLHVEKKVEVPADRPLIFASNHGFIEDAACMSIMAEGSSYYMFGSLPQAYNTFFGIAAYVTGMIAVNRRDKNSRRASIDKALYAMELGANIIICPEGAWNKTANRLTIDFWPGVIHIAKKANALIVPLVQLLVDDDIYVSRLAPIDISQYGDMSYDEILEQLQTVYNTELMDLMDKYARTTRSAFVGQYANSLEAGEALLDDLTTACLPHYDFLCETTADYRPPRGVSALEVWKPIAELEVTKANMQHVLYARELTNRLQREDLQHRF